LLARVGKALAVCGSKATRCIEELISSVNSRFSRPRSGRTDNSPFLDFVFFAQKVVDFGLKCSGASLLLIFYRLSVLHKQAD
jgi:hypothetical protein